MANYRDGVRLVLSSWGWDTTLPNKGGPVKNKDAGQAWIEYNVRLGKMLDSLYLFNEAALFNSVKAFVNALPAAQKNAILAEAWITTIFQRILP